MLFRITTQCNLECPWCVLEYDKFSYKFENYKLLSEDSLEIAIEYMKSTGDTYFCISGGEPLLYPEILKKYFLQVKKSIPNVTFAIVTNGTLLTKDLVQFFNTNKIKVSISLSITGYKGILNLISKCKENANVIKYIRELIYKRIHIVIQRNIPFANEATVLHYLFNSRIEYIPNYLDMEYYNEDDILFIKNELEYLAKINNNDLSWFSILFGNNSYCTCKNKYMTIDVNNKIKPMMPNDIPMYGCHTVFERMNIDIYNQYCVLVSNFNYKYRKDINFESFSSIYNCGL